MEKVVTTKRTIQSVSYVTAGGALLAAGGMISLLKTEQKSPAILMISGVALMLGGFLLQKTDQ